MRNVRMGAKAVGPGRYGAAMTAQTPPNWYPDPQNPALVRWWDGQRWTEHVQERDAAAPPPSPAQAQVPAPAPAAPAQEPAGGRRKIGFFNARSAARDLAAENDELREIGRASCREIG